MTETPYWLFAGETYYPDGGWGDFRGAFPTVEAALVVLAAVYHTLHPLRPVPSEALWYEIIDIRRRAVVQTGGCKGGA
jgi:hypothetical protein